WRRARTSGARSIRRGPICATPPCPRTPRAPLRRAPTAHSEAPRRAGVGAAFARLDQRRRTVGEPRHVTLDAAENPLGHAPLERARAQLALFGGVRNERGLDQH